MSCSPHQSRHLLLRRLSIVPTEWTTHHHAARMSLAESVCHCYFQLAEPLNLSIASGRYRSSLPETPSYTASLGFTVLVGTVSCKSSVESQRNVSEASQHGLMPSCQQHSALSTPLDRIGQTSWQMGVTIFAGFNLRSYWAGLFTVVKGDTPAA